MKPCRATLIAIAVGAFLTGCATTDNELTQKERDRIARDLERDSQKEARTRAQAQEKMMRDSGQRRGSR